MPEDQPDGSVLMAGSRQSLAAVPPETFAAKLRSKRVADDLTQAELGERFNVKQQTVGAWERGERPQAGQLPKLAEYIGLASERELSALLDRETAAQRAASAAGDHIGWDQLTDAQVMKRVTQAFIDGVRTGTLTADDRPLFRAIVSYFQQRADSA